MEVKKKRFWQTQKFWRLNAYAAGDMMQGSRIVTNTYFAVFLYGVVGMQPWVVGLMFLFVRLFDGITDVLMGMVIDRTRTRWGSCRPFFVLQAPLIFVTTILMWSSWGITHPVAQFFYFFAALFLFDSAGSVAWVSYESYLPKITNTYDERRKHVNARMIYSGISLVVMIYIFDIIAGAEAARNNIAFNDIFSPEFSMWFTQLGVIMGIIFSLPMLIVAFGTRETNALPKLMNDRRTVKYLYRQYREVLSSKTYRKFFSLRLIQALVGSFTGGIVTVMALLLFGADDIPMNLPVLGMVTLIFLAINVSGAVEIAFFVPNVVIMKKYGKQSPFFLCLPLLMVASLIGIFIWIGMPIWLFLVMMAFLGAGRSSLGFVSSQLLPDLADVDEMIYGKRREGGAAGLNELGAKSVSGIGSFTNGIILSAFGLQAAYLRDGVAPSPGAINAIRVIFGVMPIICCVAIILVTLTYRLDRKRHAMVKEFIARKKQDGICECSEDEKRECELLTGHKWHEMWIGRQRDAGPNITTPSDTTLPPCLSESN